MRTKESHKVGNLEGDHIMRNLWTRRIRNLGHLSSMPFVSQYLLRAHSARFCFSTKDNVISKTEKGANLMELTFLVGELDYLL